MAIIYQRTGTWIDRMVILEPREALIYPFDLGADWKELRLGAFLSYTTEDNLNKSDAVSNTSQFLDYKIDSNNYYFGFIGWTGDIKNLYELPKLTGTFGSTVATNPNYVNYFGYVSAFIGNSPQQTEFYKANNNSNVVLGGLPGGGFGNGKGMAGFISTSGFTFTTPSLDTAGIILPSGNQAVTGRYYTTFNMIKLRRNIDNNTYRIVVQSYNQSISSAVFHSDSPTIENCRLGFARPDNEVNLPFSTGMITHNGRSNGQLYEPPPSGIIIYCPFYAVRLRIHALVVERYD